MLLFCLLLPKLRRISYLNILHLSSLRGTQQLHRAGGPAGLGRAPAAFPFEQGSLDLSMTRVP